MLSSRVAGIDFRVFNVLLERIQNGMGAEHLGTWIDEQLTFKYYINRSTNERK